MHKYFIKIPWIIKKFFSEYVWSFSSDDTVYLTFDDGPHPLITPWVLEELKKYNAKASFFCIGNNVEKYPEVYQEILRQGHAVGNHSYHHLNGWKTDDKKYVADVMKASYVINSNLFRPPYGRIKNKQAKQITSLLPGVKIIMWDVLSSDFDPTLSPQQCLKNVIANVSGGSVVVFHDSEKAFNHLKFVLPKVLDFLNQQGYKLKKIEL